MNDHTPEAESDQGRCRWCGEPARNCPNADNECCCLPCYEHGHDAGCFYYPSCRRDCGPPCVVTPPASRVCPECHNNDQDACVRCITEAQS